MSVLLLGLACAKAPEVTGSLRPGDSLFDRLDASRLESYPATNLSPEILDLASTTIRVRTLPLPGTRWMAFAPLPEPVVAALGGATTVRYWFLKPPLARAADAPGVRVIVGAAPAIPWAPGEGPFPGRVIWWDEEKDTLYAFSEQPPEEVAVEYSTEPGRLFGEYERSLSAADAVGGPTDAGSPSVPAPASLRREEEIQEVARRCLLLPAPGSLAFPVESCPSPKLRVAVGLVDHSYRRVGDLVERSVGGSDGAEFVVEVESGSETRRVWSRTARPGEPFVEEHVDLSDWVGRSITLRLRTGPGAKGDRSFDYALWGDLRFVGGAQRRPERPHVVLVVIDTLRADGLGAYGASRPTSPRIDAWAASKATVYRDALATAPWTLPSVASILTGLTSRQHGVHQTHDALSPEVPTLTAQLADAGYETRAVTGGGFLRAAFGLHHRFERYDSRFFREVPREEVLDWIETRGSERPFFLFFHTYFPHAPYPFDDRFLDRDPRYGGPLAGRDITYPDVIDPYNDGVLDLDAADRGYVRALYDALLAKTDAFVGKFLERLEEILEGEDLALVLTSDHGEELFEHGQMGHGQSLYEELLRVPLVVRFPRGGEDAPKIGMDDRPVSTLDVVPTILDVVGLERHENLSGRSLRGEIPARRMRFAEEPANRLLATFLGEDKLILGSRQRPRIAFGPVQLFDRLGDPGEAQDLHAARRERVEELTRILDRFLERYGPVSTGSGVSSSPDAELIRTLRELGYLGDR